jgi:hypothetical protein
MERGWKRCDYDEMLPPFFWQIDDGKGVDYDIGIAKEMCCCRVLHQCNTPIVK